MNLASTDDGEADGWDTATAIKAICPRAMEYAYARFGVIVGPRIILRADSEEKTGCNDEPTEYPQKTLVVDG